MSSNGIQSRPSAESQRVLGTGFSKPRPSGARHPLEPLIAGQEYIPALSAQIRPDQAQFLELVENFARFVEVHRVLALQHRNRHASAVEEQAAGVDEQLAAIGC